MLGGSKFTADWSGDGDVWDAFRETCPPCTEARRLFASLRFTGQTHSPRLRKQIPNAWRPPTQFTFAPDTDHEFDFCANPMAHFHQGAFFSDWRTISALYPVFSPASSDGFSDIVIPPHYYYSPSRRYTYGWDPATEEISETDANEVEWEKKTNRIYWRGATTGGGSTPPGFSSGYQRHRCVQFSRSRLQMESESDDRSAFSSNRFVQMSSDYSDTNMTITHADPPGSDKFFEAQVPRKEMNKAIMDVAFTKVCLSLPPPLSCIPSNH